VARTVALRRLDSAPRTYRELLTYVCSKGVPESAAIGVLDRFVEVGLLDDRAYALQWVTERFSLRGTSRAMLRRELRAKGIAEELIDEALATIVNDQESERALELAQSRLRRHQRDEPAAAVRKIAGFLSRRGYGSNVAWSTAHAVVYAADGVVSCELEAGEG